MPVYETLPVTIPELPSAYQRTPNAERSSHPFSKSSHKPYRPAELAYNAGARARTEVFEQLLVGIYWKIGRPVPYIFRTAEGGLRSQDAGCLGILRSELEFGLDESGYIAAVKPGHRLLSKYQKQRPQLLVLIDPNGNAFAFDAIADEVAMAEQSQIDRRTEALIARDLLASAMEGLTEEQRIKVRLRAIVVSSYKLMSGDLICEDCGFDPAERTTGTLVNFRSLLDVHHKRPLDEGVRRTTLLDFILLCPTCHRFAHALARSQEKHT
jgi:hypothetical protein